MESSFKINGIAHNKITSLWSQANGQAEQINRVIKKGVQSAVKDVIGKMMWIFLRPMLVKQMSNGC